MGSLCCTGVSAEHVEPSWPLQSKVNSFRSIEQFRERITPDHLMLSHLPVTFPSFRNPVRKRTGIDSVYGTGIVTAGISI